jgi:DNA-directed RNA polymerase specialized sigma24 family protein
MSDVPSVTWWLQRLKAGQRDAATEKLWQAYFTRLVRLAQARLHHAPRRAADAEDVALSVFASFVRAVEAGRFPRLDDRHDLWQVLLVLTVRKTARLVREQAAVRRGGRVQVLPALEGIDPESDEPDPAEAAAMAEECGRLLGMLDNPELRRLAVWKLEGYSNEEIADQLGKAVGTVERKLRLIRQIWHDEAGA